MRSVVFTLTVTLIAINFLRAQSVYPSVINSSGGSYSDNASFRIDWAVGELALVHRMTGLNSTMITNGFLQPFLGDATANTGAQFGADEIFVFPSPATDFIEINFRTRQQGTVKYSLYTASGQVIYEGTFTSTGIDRIEQIKTNTLASGVYILRINLIPTAGSVAKKGTYKILKAH